LLEITQNKRVTTDNFHLILSKFVQKSCLHGIIRKWQGGNYAKSKN